MMTDEAAMLFYGEPMTEDEHLCIGHGCRLTYRYGIGFACPECEETELEEEREEWRLESERLQKEHPFPPDERAGCKFIVGKDFVAFQCTMPWWA